MQICMDILIKMRGDIFTMCFLMQCSSDFNYAIQERKIKEKDKILFQFVSFILTDKQNTSPVFHCISRN